MTSPSKTSDSDPTPIPDGYDAHTIESAQRDGDHLIVTYGGKIFGGIVSDLLASDRVREAVRPGSQIIVRHHTEETGQLGQIAHMLIKHPDEPGWAELYADWE
jgi:hypothetical protein